MTHSLPFWYPPILAYHRVHPDGATDTPTISPTIFEKQMAIIRNRWKPVSLLELVERLEQGKPLDRRAAVVTFDDGTEDQFTCAYPILAKYRIPATIFLILDNLDRPGSLRKSQLAEMARGGIAFGSHTLHHAYLPSLGLEQVRQELVESKHRLEELGLDSGLLSYPGGGFSEELIRITQEAGYRAACTTNRGFQHFPVNRWALRRISLHANATTPFAVWLRACGYYGLNRRLRDPSATV